MKEKEKLPRIFKDILVEEKLGKLVPIPLESSLYFTVSSLIDKFGKAKDSSDRWKGSSTDEVEFKKGRNLFRAYLTTGVLPSRSLNLHISSVSGRSQKRLETDIFFSSEECECLIESGNFERELTNREKRNCAKFLLRMEKKLEVLKEKEALKKGSPH